MTIIDGKQTALNIRAELKEKVGPLRKKGKRFQDL